MTGVLQLDLTADSDEGLLVPFGGSKAALLEESNPLVAPPPKRRPFFLFRKHDKENTATNDKPKEKKQVVTFSFPTAMVDSMNEPLKDPAASDKPSSQPRDENTESCDKKEKQEKDNESKESDSKESKDEKEEHTVFPEKEVQQRASSRSSNADKQKDGLVENDELNEVPVLPKMEGHGTPVEEDNAIHAMGRFFRRFSPRHSDMKSMKIATEDTKDDRTFGESVTHVLQVALAPEIYASDEEGEGNLGFYRPIRSAPRPQEQWQVAMKKQAREFQSRISKMRARIHELQEELKSKDLEARTWRDRAHELEKQLREYQQGGGDDDSSAGPRETSPDNDMESESGIDHEWKEDNSTTVKEGELIDTDIVPEKVEFDPLSAETKKPSSPTTDDNEDMVALTSLVSAIVSMDEILEPNKSGEVATGKEQTPAT